MLRPPLTFSEDAKIVYVRATWGRQEISLKKKGLSSLPESIAGLLPPPFRKVRTFDLSSFSSLPHTHSPLSQTLTLNVLGLSCGHSAPRERLYRRREFGGQCCIGPRQRYCAVDTRLDPAKYYRMILPWCSRIPSRASAPRPLRASRDRTRRSRTFCLTSSIIKDPRRRRDSGAQGVLVY